MKFSKFKLIALLFICVNLSVYAAPTGTTRISGTVAARQTACVFQDNISEALMFKIHNTGTTDLRFPTVLMCIFQN